MTKVRVTAAIMDFTEDAFLKDEKNTLNVKVDTEGKVNEKQNEENPEEKAEKDARGSAKYTVGRDSTIIGYHAVNPAGESVVIGNKSS